MNKVFFIVEIGRIFDKDKYDYYIKNVGGIINSFGGRYIVRSNDVVSFTGDAPQRCIIVEFTSQDAADRCFSSAEYLKIKHFREESTDSRAFFVRA
ncbi:MAG: DUF1330 domain-containing protein [Candidatus Omnitrophica bacterium]|nr:DUF1330 domain-containing protein [Candidatus Omnitrophota bacterium]MDD5081086.1 DUF1330 domain-containing protein [Candidatus Omnitrophota bacterium]